MSSSRAQNLSAYFAPPPSSLLDHPGCPPCVLQLFPCCGSSLCYFVSAWLQLSPPPPTHRDQSSSVSPASFFPTSFSSLCSCPERAGEGGGFCLPCRCPSLLKRGYRGHGCLLLGREVIQAGIPHLWQVLTRASRPVTPGIRDLCG